jgi:uncharacterized protein YggU (UPF0235/DUF167 family)
MSDKRKYEFTDARGGTAIPVKVVTQSDVSELSGIGEDGVLKARLKATPAGDPAANAELIALLAQALDVPQSKIEIVVGQNAREKIVSVEGINAHEVERRLGFNS